MSLLTIIFCLLVARPQQQPAKPPPKPKPAAESKKTPQKTPARKRVVTDLSGFDLLEPGKVRRQTTAVGATRSLAAPVALAPKLGKLYAVNPAFAWSYSGSVSRLVFVLWDDQQQELYRSEVSGDRYSYPPSAPRLQEGKTYFWTIEASSPGMTPNSSAPAGVLVVSGAQRKEIEAALIGRDDFSRAKIFTDRRVWYDAVAAYSDLIARFPHRADLYEQRGTIYAQLPVTRALADRDFTRAEELGKKP